MPDVLLSNDDVTVLGPPNTVEVLVDIGPTGTRGSKVFVGSGNPNDETVSGVIFGQTLVLNDLYINTSPGGELGYLYQYRSEPGGNVWVEVLDIYPSVYSENAQVTFESGTSEVIIPVADIVTVTGTPLTSDNFSVQYSIAHTNPVASAMQIPALVGAGTNLVINLEAVEYTGAAWSALDESVTIHFNITIVEAGAVS
jgi:hypothetical protein